MLRLKSILLIAVFLLGNNGFSFDLAQCCNSLTGVSIGLGQTHVHQNDKDDCCACLTIKKTKRSCCEDIVLQTGINQGLSIERVLHAQFKVKKSVETVFTLNPNFSLNLNRVNSEFNYPQKNLQRPIPVLIQKRVLQI